MSSPRSIAAPAPPIHTEEYDTVSWILSVDFDLAHGAAEDAADELRRSMLSMHAAWVGPIFRTSRLSADGHVIVEQPTDEHRRALAGLLRLLAAAARPNAHPTGMVFYIPAHAVAHGAALRRTDVFRASRAAVYTAAVIADECADAPVGRSSHAAADDRRFARGGRSVGLYAPGVPAHEACRSFRASRPRRHGPCSGSWSRQRAISALDAFLVEELLPKPGPTAFVSKLARSVS